MMRAVESEYVLVLVQDSSEEPQQEKPVAAVPEKAAAAQS